VFGNEVETVNISTPKLGEDDFDDFAVQDGMKYDCKELRQMKPTAKRVETCLREKHSPNDWTQADQLRDHGLVPSLPPDHMPFYDIAFVVVCGVKREPVPALREATPNISILVGHEGTECCYS
jgi:hypothetical protein